MSTKLVESLKEFLKVWSGVIFSANGVLCTYGLLIALILAIEVPLRYALIICLVPVAVALGISLILFGVLRWSYTNWRVEFDRISKSQTYTLMIDNFVLPILLCVLFFYMRGNLEQANLYATSPVHVEMLVHPCGSSYDRTNNNVWDAADLISQPSNNEVFIITNAAFGINQTQRECGQTGAYCTNTNSNPGQIYPKWLGTTRWVFSHDLAEKAVWLPIRCPENQTTCDRGVMFDNGIQTGRCHNSEVIEGGHCGIRGWCPPVTLKNFSDVPLFPDTARFSIFLDMHPNFTEFSGVSWTSGGENGYSEIYAEIYARHNSYKKSIVNCVYNPKTDPYCPRFFLQDIVEIAGGNFTQAASLGGQFTIEVHWDCNFDWGKDIYDCLPYFKFLNRQRFKGKPKTYSQVSKPELNQRTVTYSLGISVTINQTGRGFQIQLLNLYLTAQFVYISYKMLRRPLLLIFQVIMAFGAQANKNINNSKNINKPNILNGQESSNPASTDLDDLPQVTGGNTISDMVESDM